MKSVLLAAALLAPFAVRAADPLEFSVGAFTFERPPEWTWIKPSSPMRKAQLEVRAGGNGAAADVVFFHFGAGQGGSVDANVQRWTGQFEGGAEAANAMKWSETFGSVAVTFVKAEGTYKSGMPGAGFTTPMPGYALLGAILSHPDGDVYVKMTGPKAVVEGASRAFDEMVRVACEKLK